MTGFPPLIRHRAHPAINGRSISKDPHWSSSAETKLPVTNRRRTRYAYFRLKICHTIDIINIIVIDFSSMADPFASASIPKWNGSSSIPIWDGKVGRTIISMIAICSFALSPKNIYATDALRPIDVFSTNNVIKSSYGLCLLLTLEY